MDTLLAANIINSLVALATFAAVIVALFAIGENRKQAKEDWQHNKQLAVEERQHQSRPIVVPVGEISHYTSDGYVDWDAQYQLTAQELQARIHQARQQNPNADPNSINIPATEPGTQRLKLQNMGEGVAFNVHCILYGALHTPEFQYVSWNNGPIQGKSDIQVVSTHGPTVLDEHTKVDGTHILYDPFDQNYRIARLTITYHDIFDRKHVSIYDYLRISTTEHRWMHVATNSGIEYDLEELDDQKRQPPAKRKPIK